MSIKDHKCGQYGKVHMFDDIIERERERESRFLLAISVVIILWSVNRVSIPSEDTE